MKPIQASSPGSILYGLKNFSDRILLRDDMGTILSYADIDQCANAEPFKKTKRSLVLCMMDNSIGGIAGYLALLAADAVPMLINPLIAADLLQDLIQKYEPEFVWLPISRINEWPMSRVEFEYYGYCLIVLARSGKSFELNPALGLILSTSGSTGSSKYVRLSKDNICANAASIVDYLLLTTKDFAITSLPPFYSYGLSVIHSHVYVGAAIAVTNTSFFDRRFWNFLSDAKVTSMAGIPYHYKILKKLRFANMNLPYLHTLTQAGGHMDIDLTREFASICSDRGIRFFTMYGQTEASPRMAFVPPEQALAKAGSIGIAIPGGAFELKDEAGSTINQPFTEGELIYRGPNVCMGYAQKRKDLSLGDINHGILKTGDIAQFDLEGFYTIMGRKNRYIKLYGNRINLQDVEQLLTTKGFEVACEGNDDELRIYIVGLTKSHAMDLKKIITISLQVNIQSIAIYAIDVLPRNIVGKILYSQLQFTSKCLLA